MHRKSSSPRVWDGRAAELSEMVERRLDALLGSRSREPSRPRCARPEILLDLMVCRSQVPLGEIAEALGFEDPKDFSYWCESLTGLPPRALRELGAPRPVRTRPEERLPEEPAGMPEEPAMDEADSVGPISPGPEAPPLTAWCRLVTVPLERLQPADRAALEWFEAKRAAAPRPSGSRSLMDPED